MQKDPNQEEINFVLNLLSLNKLEEAKKEITKKMLQYKKSSILFNLLGAVLANQKNFDEAIENYQKSIEINPKYAQAYNNLGIVFHKKNKIEEAIENYKKAINLKNNFPEAFNNLGSAVRDSQKKKEEAIPYFEKAIQINPNYAEPFNNLGLIYQSLNFNERAIENYKKAVKIKPDFVEAYNNLAELLSEASEFEESLKSYKKILEIKPNSENTYNNLGNLLNSLGKYEEATTAYEKAIKIKPDFAIAHSNLLLNLNYEFNFDHNNYLKKAKEFKLNCSPKKKISIKYKYKKNPDKLRIGFVSSDFGNHPGGYFSLSTLKELRKKNFELIAYSTADRNDELSANFRSIFAKWNSIEKIKDEKIVENILNDEIHILIEMQGHSGKNRLPLFIYKPAPIQVSWLSQGTTGISEIDYLIGSSYITPKNEEDHFVETIWRLPNITQCFTLPDFDLKINSLPAIKKNFITFGCVNKLNKINNKVISLWSKILISVNKSKLVLKTKGLENKSVYKNILDKFKKNNIEEDRLILIGESKTRKEVLNIYNEIDIALDPFPFQGNTSTIEAIWMGVPVLVLKGDRFLSHFGESINSNLNMYNWIANNDEDYVDKAVKFSSDIQQLKQIRENLRSKALESPIFDFVKFGENFSEMLWKMWKNFENS